MTTNGTLNIDGHPRSEVGKRARYLRRQGITPANLYGRGMESVAFQVETRELERIVDEGARSALVNVSMGGEQHSALLRVVQRHPVTRLMLHAEFFRVELDRLIQTQVPIHVVGEAPAARLPMALISQIIHEITVECFPMDIPPAIEVDLSPLVEIGDSILVRDLETPDATTILAEPEQAVVRAGQGRVALEAAALDAEAKAALEKGAEQTEGAATTEAVEGDERSV